jgi:hypothetical protein
VKQFYVVTSGGGFEILSMTPEEAKYHWESGRKWVGLPRLTKAEAAEFISLLLSPDPQR